MHNLDKDQEPSDDLLCPNVLQQWHKEPKPQQVVHMTLQNSICRSGSGWFRVLKVSVGLPIV